MRPVCLSRKNSLFAGSDEGGANWACLASLVETCKLNNVNPQLYFTDLLTRLVNRWPQNRIDELMPWHWTTKSPAEKLNTPRAVEHRLRTAVSKNGFILLSPCPPHAGYWCSR